MSASKQSYPILDFINVIRAVLRLSPIYETGDSREGPSVPVYNGPNEGWSQWAKSARSRSI